MLNKITTALFFLLFVSITTIAQTNTIDQYNVIWKTQSKNVSESMPCGGGDIGLNVWVENGDLSIYMARSGSFDENNALLKEGRLHVTLTPSVFDDKNFKEELHLQDGYITVSGEKNDVNVTVKIWVDVFAPIVYLDINSNKKMMATAAYESWRYQNRILQPRENFGNSWKWAAHENTVGRKDSIAFVDNTVWFYHHNISPNIFDATVSEQGLDNVKDSLYNPLKDLCFGGALIGKNFVADGTYEGVYINTDFKGWQLKSKAAATNQSLQIYFNTQQTIDVANWKNSVDSLQKTNTNNDDAAFKRTQQWWQQFWNRSFIFINDDTSSVDWQVGRNYQLFRYMLGCNAKGIWPTKFNDGLFTVDPVFTDSSTKIFEL